MIQLAGSFFQFQAEDQPSSRIQTAGPSVSRVRPQLWDAGLGDGSPGGSQSSCPLAEAGVSKARGAVRPGRRCRWDVFLFVKLNSRCFTRAALNTLLLSSELHSTGLKW